MDDCKALVLVEDHLSGIEKKADSGTSEISLIADIQPIQKYCSVYGKFASCNPEFEKINALAYFDYQREKVFLKGNKNVKNNVATSEKETPKAIKPIR